MNKRVTIRDVAKAAGVSITTTSQVMKGIGRYSDATTKRVWDVVTELNYSHNIYAKKFFAKDHHEHQNVGLLMRITCCPYDVGFFDPAGHEPIRMFYFEHSCMKHNYCGTNYIFRHELGFQNRLLVNDVVDGLILGLASVPLLNQLREWVPAVLTDINVEPEVVGMPVINCDLVRGFSELLKLMLDSGIPGRMAIFAGYDAVADAMVPEEMQAVDMKRAANLCKVELEDRHNCVIPVNSSNNAQVMGEIAYRIAVMVKKEGVRIVGIRNLGPLTLLKKLLTQHSLRLPQDLVLLGLSDMPLNEPGIAALTYDWEKMMDTSVEVLLRRIKEKKSICGKYLVPPQEIDDAFLQPNVC